jgi:dihydrolipoamide dehydrogenase
MYDVIIIGAGPAGYVAALRAGQLGMKTLLIERGRIGGRALHAGVVPSKGMLESARFFRQVMQASHFGVEGLDTQHARFSLRTALQRSTQVAERMSAGIEAKLEARRVERIRGEAKIASDTSVSVENRVIEGRHIILATGSDTVALPFDIPSDRTRTAWTALSAPEAPERVVVLGTTPVAVEYAQLFSMLGSTVTLATAMPRLLPMLGRRLVEAVTQRLQSAGVEVITDAGTYSYGNDRLKIGTENAPCDMVVNCIAERGILPGGDISLVMAGYFPTVDAYLRTSVETIYAVGNVNGLMPTARSASAQGLYAVNNIAGVTDPWVKGDEPVVVYGEPEVAQIGRTEAELEADGVDFRIVEAPLSENSTALIRGAGDGFVRILFERAYGEVLGVQILAENASDLIGEAAAIMRFEGTVYDAARTAHAHPTISEVFMNLGQTAGEDIAAST